MEYVAWVRINHSECCFSVGSSSSVSASSHANHVSPVTNTSSNPNSEDHPVQNASPVKKALAAHHLIHLLEVAALTK